MREETLPLPPGVRVLQFAGAIVATAGLLSGCAGGGRALPTHPSVASESVPFDGPISPAEQARITAMVARVKAKLADGYVFRSTGTATSAVVRADGSSSILLGSGHFMHVSIVPKSEAGDRITFDGPQGRAPQFTSTTCYDGCDSSTDGGSTPTPDPQPSPPPNYSSCKSAGGATWFDESSGIGGCLGPGASRTLSCGFWSYSSPGKGKFQFFSGQTMDGVGWISDNGYGSCRLG
jgi:hypothetical protein